VHVDRAGVAREGVSPHALEELVAGEDEPLVVEKLPQEIELLRREPDLLLADVALAAARVEHQVAVADDPAVGLCLADVSAEDRPHPRYELTWIERLREVVVGSNLEPRDLVEVVVARRQHQHGQRAHRADAPADLHPVEVGQHQVENHERRRLGADNAQGLLAARRDPDQEAVLAEVGGDE
jgi:hypothetical protein